jgi:site-specific DNA-methyltransferase (adenine-specific)
MDKIIDKRLGAEREVIGENPTWREAKRDNEVYQTVDGGSAEYLTAPATDEAKYYSGSYASYQPKPAYELVLVAMKPLSEPTYVDQALEHYRQRQEGETTVGPGVTWLDDGRIPTIEEPQVGSGKLWSHYRDDTEERAKAKPSGDRGRFAPNLLVEDDALSDGVRRSSAKSTKKHGAYEGESKTGFLRGDSHPGNQHGDAGSLSRFFDLDAWFNERLKDLPESVRKTFPFLYAPKPSKSEKEKGCDDIWVLKEGVPSNVVEKLTTKMQVVPQRQRPRHRQAA